MSKTDKTKYTEIGLRIGYDLCNDFCRVSYATADMAEPRDVHFSDGENPYLIQNAIAKKKGKDEWLIGEDAFEAALLGDGIVVDKLLRLVAREGFATFEKVRFPADELLCLFIKKTLEITFSEAKTRNVEKILFTVRELNGTVLDAIVKAMENCNIKRDKVHIVSHAESFLYYVLSQKKELWLNTAVLYDCTGDGLNYYELNVIRGVQPNIVKVQRQFLEEGFSTDILATASGRKMADAILSSCSDRMLSKRLISTCFLSGDGMDNCQEWGENFLKGLCRRRKVYFIENLFAKGAVYAAIDRLTVPSRYPFRFMCEGRINVDISIDVQSQMTQKTLALALAGSNWYESRAELDIIPDMENSLVLRVRAIGEKVPERIEIPFDNLISRGNKRTRIGLKLYFSGEDVFRVRLTDKGFGEFFPATGAAIEKEFTIDSYR